MKSKLLLSAAAFGLALPIAAVVAPELASTKMLSGKSNLNVEKATVNMATENNLRIAEAPAKNGPKKVVILEGDQAKAIEDYGTLELLLEEDFSLMTDGSEAEPALETVIDMTREQVAEMYGNEYVWWNVYPQYTHKPCWGSGNAFPAGGCLYFNCEADYMGRTDGAKINTCLVDASKDGGIAVLEFKAKSQSATPYEALLVEAAETYNMSPSWDDIDDIPVFIYDIPNEWTTYRLIFRGCGPSSLFNIVGMTPGGLFIDDIKVYQLHQTVAVPTALPHSDYKGTSFQANWTETEGADGYYLTVYSYNEEKEEVEFLFKDAVTENNSRVIEGVESGKEYFYFVKAFKGKKESIPSNTIDVFDLETPKMNAAELDGDFSYTASWSKVPSADVYNYIAYTKRVAEADGEFIVTNEDFTGITDAEGNTVDWTEESDTPGTYDKNYPTTLHQQGWYGLNYRPMKDFIAVDAFHYVSNGKLTGFSSPVLDLSKDGGKFHISVKVYGAAMPYWDENDNQTTLYTQCQIVIQNYDEKTGNYPTVQNIIIPNMKNEWQTFEVDCDKGTDKTIIGFYATGSTVDLYLDDIKITQNYKKGESLIDPFLFVNFYGKDENVVDNTKMKVNVPLERSGAEVYHQVSAVKRRVDERGNSYDDAESPYSEMEFARMTINEVKEVVLKEFTASLNGETLTITNPMGREVTVIDAEGRVLFSTSEQEATVVLNAKGVYFVKGGSQVEKVIL